MFVNEKCLPSGEKFTPPIRASAGTCTCRSAPVAIVRNVIPVPAGARCGPLFNGLIRMPGQTQHWLGHFRDRRHVASRQEGEHIPRRAHLDARQRWSIDDIDDGLGRRQIARLGGASAGLSGHPGHPGQCLLQRRPRLFVWASHSSRRPSILHPEP